MVEVIVFVFVMSGIHSECTCFLGKDFLFYRCNSQVLPDNFNHLYHFNHDTVFYYSYDENKEVSNYIKLDPRQEKEKWIAEAVKKTEYIDTGLKLNHLGLSGSVFEEVLSMEIHQGKQTSLNNMQLRVDPMDSFLVEFFTDNPCARYLPFYRTDEGAPDLPPLLLADWSDRYGKLVYAQEVTKIERVKMTAAEVKTLLSIFPNVSPGEK